MSIVRPSSTRGSMLFARVLLFLTCLSFTACTSTAGARDRFVVLESQRFT